MALGRTSEGRRTCRPLNKVFFAFQNSLEQQILKLLSKFMDVQGSMNAVVGGREEKAEAIRNLRELKEKFINEWLDQIRDSFWACGGAHLQIWRLQHQTSQVGNFQDEIGPVERLVSAKLKEHVTTIVDRLVGQETSLFDHGDLLLLRLYIAAQGQGVLHQLLGRWLGFRFDDDAPFKKWKRLWRKENNSRDTFMGVKHVHLLLLSNWLTPECPLMFTTSGVATQIINRMLPLSGGSEGGVAETDNGEPLRKVIGRLGLEPAQAPLVVGVEWASESGLGIASYRFRHLAAKTAV